VNLFNVFNKLFKLKNHIIEEIRRSQNPQENDSSETDSDSDEGDEIQQENLDSDDELFILN